MRKFLCFIVSVLLAMYGGCYIEKCGTDDLPTAAEFQEYLTDKTVQAYNTLVS